MVLKDLPVISSVIKEYIESGKSFFLPSIPYYNLLIEISQRFPNANFTTGHLLDLIIIINLVFYIESSIYHYLKKVYFNGGIFSYCESSSLEYYGIYSLDKNSEKHISIEKIIPYDFLEAFFDDKTRNNSLTERINYYSYYLNKKKVKEKQSYKNLLSKKFKSFFYKLNKNGTFFYAYSFSILLFILCLNINSFSLTQQHFLFEFIPFHGKNLNLPKSNIFISKSSVQIKLNKKN